MLSNPHPIGRWDTRLTVSRRRTRFLRFGVRPCSRIHILLAVGSKTPDRRPASRTDPIRTTSKSRDRGSDGFCRRSIVERFAKRTGPTIDVEHELTGTLFAQAISFEKPYWFLA